MKKKKQANKKSERAANDSRLSLKIALFATLGIIFLFGIVWLQTELSRSDVYSRDKNTVKADIRSILDRFGPQGTVLYDTVQDDQCKLSYATGLGGNPVCSASGYKFYRHTGHISEDLHSAEKIIKQLGFQRFFLSGQEDKDFETALQGGEAGKTITYNRNSKQNDRTSLQLSYYVNDSIKNDNEILPLLTSGSISHPGPAEYIYGIRVDTGYFSCTKNCPPLPSPLQRQP